MNSSRGCVRSSDGLGRIKLEFKRRQTMRTQSDGDLTAVMDIVLNQMPDHPLARNHFRFAVILPRPSLRPISLRPSSYGIVHAHPSGFQSANEFFCTSVLRPPAIPFPEGLEFISTHSH